MKTKIILIIGLMMGLSISGNSQGIDLNSHPKKDSILLEIAKQTVLTHGPDYYRDHQSPKITRENTNSYKQLPSKTIEVNHNKFFYIVEFPANERDLRNRMKYSAIVLIWEDSGEPFIVRFGIGHGFTLENMTVEERSRYVMEYRDLPKPKPREVIIYDYNGNIIERRMQEVK